VAKLDRLFRSVADAANVIADFDTKGIQLVSIGESFDMSSPYGRAMAQMASVFAELERAMIRERTRSAMSVKRSRGERISGYAPVGWDFGRGGYRQAKNSAVSTSVSGISSGAGWRDYGPWKAVVPAPSAATPGSALNPGMSPMPPMPSTATCPSSPASR
jgi:hypothetical protein